MSWGGPPRGRGGFASASGRRIAAILAATMAATFGGSAVTAGAAAAQSNPPAPPTTTTTTPKTTTTTAPKTTTTTAPKATTTTPGAPPAITPGWVLPPTTVPPTPPPTNPPVPAYDPATDINSMASTASYLGAGAFWDAGFTGRGVDVAVIDSGVLPVAGLDGPDKVVYGPDLSFESQSPDLRNLDTFGHGTFMAGLIAGHDRDLAAPYSSAPASQYRGVAPDARIVSLKVATADGGVDVSQVIAAIDWVVQHRNDNGMNIRVLNLSYSLNSAQDYLVDPLAFAVEQASKAGIFVVASSGNAGYVKKAKGSGNIGMPARDPFVVGIGASDPGRTRALLDDTVPSFSSSGGTNRRNDFVAPGSHLQGLRAPGSFIDVNHPEGRLGDRYFRGSGTSQAAAIVSGAAALVIQQHPTITPSRLKKLLVSSTVHLQKYAPELIGHGELDLTRALSAKWDKNDSNYKSSTGAGSLELARGSDHLSDGNVILSGEQDIFGMPFNSVSMAALEAARTSWTGGTWNGTEWTGGDWTTGWTSPTSSGLPWTGRSWTGRSWTGRSWSGRSWSGRSWTGRSWTGRSWTGGPWADGSLSGKGWSGEVWATGSWS